METLHFFRAGHTPDEIARLRHLASSTIYGHLAAAVEAGETVDLDRLFDAEARREIAGAFKRHGMGNIGGAVEALGGRYQYGQLKVFRAAATAGALRDV